jgi:quinoprotein glucose dehydrogenase
MTGRYLAAAFITLAALAACTPVKDSQWRVYGGHPSGDRYSTLTQITPTNVQQLRVAWRFDMHEQGESQTQPLVIGRTLYGYTPGLKVIALDAATGSLRWTFDSELAGTRRGQHSFAGPSRGLAYWSDGRQGRLFAGIMNYLYALDPATGRPIETFGAGGAVDLREGLGANARQLYVSLTSPGIVYEDLVIVGFRTAENAPAAPGCIRAYDVRTGSLRWTFHTLPRPGDAGSASWPENAWRTAGGANSWAGFALDEERGILYAPTGSAVPDFYGAGRSGDNLFANTLVALDARTGKRMWHFQFVHHDLWDRDLPSPPTLLTVQRDGRRIDAVAQPTKQGFLFLFDRVTGITLFPIEERATPASNVPGEVAAATQPYPVAPAAFARQQLTEEMLTNRTASAHAWAVEQFRGFRSEGQFVPFGVARPTLVFPGFDGGAEWGGAAADPTSGVIYINSNDVAWTGSLIESTPGVGPGATLYQTQCSVCHGIDRQGSPPAFPSLQELDRRLDAGQIADVIRSGRGRMPAFASIPQHALERLVEYVRTGAEPHDQAAIENGNATEGSKREMNASLRDEGEPSRFRFTGYHKFVDPDGYPAVAPPWGTLNAIDLSIGSYLWKIPLGEYPELVEQGMRETGSENYGGPILTASGLLFIGATIYDRKLRAFDSRTGALLWQTQLPFAGTATPVTYLVGRKQYLVINTSNARNPHAPQGGAYVAFALPN